MKIVLSYEDEHVLSIVGNYEYTDDRIRLTGNWSIYIGNILDATENKPTCLFLDRVSLNKLGEFYVKFSFDGINYTKATLLTSSGEHTIGIPIPLNTKCFCFGATHTRGGSAILPKEVELIPIEIAAERYTEYKFDPFEFGLSFVISSLASYGFVKTVRGVEL